MLLSDANARICYFEHDGVIATTSSDRYFHLRWRVLQTVIDEVAENCPHTLFIGVNREVFSRQFKTQLDLSGHSRLVEQVRTLAKQVSNRDFRGFERFLS